DAYREADAAADRPTVIFAYTIKGWSLPIEGHPSNHSTLLTQEQLEELAPRLGSDAADPWARFTSGTAEAELCATAAARLARPGRPGPPPPGQGLDPAGARPPVLRPGPGGAGAGRADRDREPRRRLLHQPGRLDRQGRRLEPAGARRLVRRRPGAAHALARG